MPSGWSQRRAWAVWVFVSLAGWVAIIGLITFWFSQDQNRIATGADQLTPANVMPASGPKEPVGGK